MKKVTALTMITVLILLQVIALAGTLDTLRYPGDGSDLYTLEDIYQRLWDGSAGSISDEFVEPETGPASTGHTLNEVMDLAPEADNTNGARPEDVKIGKTFWGLRTDGSGWGVQQEPFQIQGNVNGPEGALTFSIPDGYYNGKTATANDTDLVEDNIRQGVNIFGVTGSITDGRTCSGTLSPGGRWCDNGNGTVTDMTTRLVWLKRANCGGLKSWKDAQMFASFLYDGWTGDGSGGDCSLSDGSGGPPTAGYGAWRLATLSELYGLVNGSEAIRSSAPGPFDGVQSTHYWSSTMTAHYPTDAWIVNLHYGNVDNHNKASGADYVWPVRGGL